MWRAPKHCDLTRIGLAVIALLPLWGSVATAASPMVPEVLRNAASSQQPMSHVDSAMLPLTSVAPVPNLDMRPPPEPTRELSVSPTWLRTGNPYRGESFNSASELDPGRLDHHIPIPGVSVKLPLY